MLVLARKVNERIMLGDDIIITLVAIRGDKARIGIEAPDNVEVHREEIYEAVQREKKSAEYAERKRRPEGA